MTARISRLLLILMTLVVASIVLPQLYQTSFRRSPEYKSINYSEVLNDFLVVTSGKVPKIVDTKGNSYDMQRYMELIPTMSHRQLAKRGVMPDSLRGEALTPELIDAANYSIKTYNDDQGRYFGLLPLLQGGLEEVGFQNDNDFMRINSQGIEFVDAATNSIKVVKSHLFDSTLRAIGYAPPAKRIWGSFSPSAMSDNGKFFIDSQNSLFRIKYFAGKPICNKIELPEGLKVERMQFIYHGDKMAYIFDADNKIWLMRKDASLQPLPVERLASDENYSFEFWGNMFFNFVTVTSPSVTKLYVMNSDFALVDSYSLALDNYPNSTAGRIEPYIYWFRTSNYTFRNGYDFDFEYLGAFWKVLIFNLLLATALFLYKRREGVNLRGFFNLTDIVLVAVFGIFALVGVVIFPIRK